MEPTKSIILSKDRIKIAGFCSRLVVELTRRLSQAAESGEDFQDTFLEVSREMSDELAGLLDEIDPREFSPAEQMLGILETLELLKKVPSF